VWAYSHWHAVAVSSVGSIGFPTIVSTLYSRRRRSTYISRWEFAHAGIVESNKVYSQRTGVQKDEKKKKGGGEMVTARFLYLSVYGTWGPSRWKRLRSLEQLGEGAVGWVCGEEGDDGFRDET